MTNTDRMSSCAFQEKRGLSHVLNQSIFNRKHPGCVALGVSVLGASVLFAHPASAATTINVPGDQPTIQAGINAASNGDTVLVAPGTYTGSGNRNISFNGKAITVQGSGAGVTMVDVQGATDALNRAFVFTNGEGASSVVKGFTITNGFAMDGGAIFVQTLPLQFSSVVTSGPTITQCTFISNHANNSGGAIFLGNTHSTVSDCIFQGNTAVHFPNNIGAEMGGAIEVINQPIGSGGSAAYPAIGLKPAAIDPNGVRLFNNVFVANEAGFDGAAVDIEGLNNSDDPTPTVPVVYIDNCSFTGNFDDFDGGGFANTGTISFFGGNTTISNSIFYGDTTSVEISDYFGPGDSPVTVNSSDVHGGVSGASGTGNIDVDPKFVDAANGDLRLVGTSPVINAGTTFETTPSTDFSGTTRDANPDMGAFEYALDVSPTDQAVQQYATFNNQLTLFRDTSGMTASPSTFTATIDWGDGTTPTAGTITQPGGAGDFYRISGSHTYGAYYGKRPITITVTDTAVTAAPLVALGHGSINVFPVIATHYSLTIPSTIVAGIPFNATVVALDVNNNVATAYPGTVHFTSMDPKGALPANTLLTNGAGTFQTILYTAAPIAMRARDTVTSSITGLSNILVTPGPYHHFTIITPPAAFTEIPFYAPVYAKDQYENTTTYGAGYTGTVHVSSSDAKAVLPANLFLSGGAKQISIKFRTPGTQTITIKDTGGSATGTSSSISVDLEPALFVITGPAHPVAGVQTLYTVTAKDKVGNTVPAYTGTVHITSTDGRAVLPADAMLTNGVGSFYITFKSVGPQTLFAVDMESSTIKGSLSVIGVVGGVATTFTITVPSTTTVGAAFQAQVTAKDAYGNTSTSYAGTVHFTSSDPNAVLPANLTLPGGTRQITVKFKKTGNQTISAMDTTNTGLTGISSYVSVR